MGRRQRRGVQPLRRQSRKQHHPEGRRRDQGRHHAHAPSVQRPRGFAFDGSGTLYVADGSNIRTFDIATGNVTMIAGTDGEPGNADGTGLIARFDEATGIAGGGAGDYYIADSRNNAIRKLVVATGAVTTFAGSAGSGSDDGPGPNALFNHPLGIGSDGAGNLYVADTDNRTIRKIVIATGAVTTLAGAPGQAGGADGVARPPASTNREASPATGPATCTSSTAPPSARSSSHPQRSRPSSGRPARAEHRSARSRRRSTYPMASPSCPGRARHRRAPGDAILIGHL